MEQIEIIVPGEPYPWGVQAFTLGRHAALRDKPRSKEYKRRVAAAARSALEQARTIAGGEITAGTVLALSESERIELSKPLRIAARYCGQGGDT